MQRRRFLTRSLATSAASALAASFSAQGALLPVANDANQAPSGQTARQFYELRRYHLNSGPQQKLTGSYISDALIPALNRMGMSPIGAFDLYLGPETPALYVLIPSNSLETLATAELRLADDEEYLRAGRAFVEAPAKEPAYDRMESSLLAAFTGHPQLTPPPKTSPHRVFQLRTYESPSNHDHRVKVEMFNSGEYDVFTRAGFWSVFYGDTLIGPRLPNLTYMLSFSDLSELDAKWKAFGDDPAWKKLSTSPKFSYESIVSNISNLILKPTTYSQI